MESIRAKWHQNIAHAFVLKRQDQSLNECNTPVLANGSKAGCDPLVITPILEYATPELMALVADDRFRVSTSVVYGTFEKVLNRS